MQLKFETDETRKKIDLNRYVVIRCNPLKNNNTIRPEKMDLNQSKIDMDQFLELGFTIKLNRF